MMTMFTKMHAERQVDREQGRTDKEQWLTLFEAIQAMAGQTAKAAAQLRMKERIQSERSGHTPQG